MNTSNTLDMSRHNLTVFITHHVHNLSKNLGFGFEDTKEAPGTFEDLKQSFEKSRKTRLPLPVYSEASENTIFTTKHGNYAFRFWHDVLHCLHNLDFSTDQELIVAEKQLEVIKKQFGSDSLEYKLMYSDTIGQTLYFKKYGNFPENQLEFAKEYIKILEG